ncbi:MAG: L-histidine N(alpha)-methyltransferase [Phycisphaerales bacterium JB039]
MTSLNDAAGAAGAELEPEGMTRAEAAGEFRADVLAGLALPQKTIPSKHLYDARGADLFHAICDLEEYYPTRTEIAIMEQYASEMAQVAGPRPLVVEPGSGAGIKTRLLLEALDDPVALIPIDIARQQLAEVAGEINASFPALQVLPLWGDFAQPLELPRPDREAASTLVYFPGSTIGNFARPEAVDLLRNFRRMIAGGGVAIVGFDLKKDPAILRAAYNDRDGVTAEFNLNLLRRINRELGGSFDLDAFRHEAPWVAEAGRIEMRLISQRDQDVTVAGRTFRFRAGEWIWTESSHKYDEQGIRKMAAEAGLALDHFWTDDDRLFSVVALRAE